MPETPPPLSARDIWIRLLLYPGHTLPTAAAPVAVACGLALRHGVFAPLPALLALVGSWAIHLGGVFADNYELLTRHHGVREHPELNQAVESGVLRLATLRRLTVACFVTGLGLGAFLTWIGGPLPVLLGVVGVLASAGYASAGIRYARFGLAEPVFFLLFGVVAVVGTYFIQVASRAPDVWTTWIPAGSLPLEAFVVGLPVGALVTNVLVIDDLRDRAHDRAKGWRTASVRWGARGSRALYAALTAFAYLAPAVLWLGFDLSARAMLPLVTLPLALPILRAVWTRDSTAELLPMTPRASRLALAYSLLQALALAL